MLELVVGSTPRGEDYFGREDLIEALWARLRKDNVLLAAPRRFGKTGAMYRLLDAPRAPFRPLYVNVEDITTTSDFMPGQRMNSPSGVWRFSTSAHTENRPPALISGLTNTTRPVNDSS